MHSSHCQIGFTVIRFCVHGGLGAPQAHAGKRQRGHMYPLCLRCVGIAKQRKQGGKSQSVQRHVAGVLNRCLAGEKACAGFVRVQRLHFIVFGLFFKSVLQFPHLAKYRVDVSTRCRNLAVSNLCAGTAQLQTVTCTRFACQAYLSEHVSHAAAV